MNILLTGAGGFIGFPLATALLAAGHQLSCVLRPGRCLQGLAHAPGQVRVVELDFASAQTPAAWLAPLRGVDVVINAVGIFREQGRQTFESTHWRAPVALFDACALTGVKRVIQLSALGADTGAEALFLTSKKAADDHLLGLPLNAVVVQPSLVYAAGGPSAALFNRLALLPLWLLPAGDGPCLQPVHRDDVVQGLVRLVDGPGAQTRGRVVFAGARALSLASYLQALRQQLGGGRPPPAIKLPRRYIDGLARLAGNLPGSLITRESVDMLMKGNTGDASALPALLGHPARPVEGFVRVDELAHMRRAAVLDGLLPLARWSLALVWLWTAAVSLGLYPVEDSLALLARVGATGLPALWLLYGAAALDFALGVATLACPAKLRRPLWLVQLALIAGYTLLISFFLPEYWLHPYGPVLKNIPMAMLILMLYLLETVPRPETGASHGIPAR